MMRTSFIVFVKEIIDNLRDRRTLASALIMGPIFGPALFAFAINLSIEQSIENSERAMELPVVGAQYAPNLMRYLQSENIDVVDAPGDKAQAIEAVTTGSSDVILVIPEDFGEQLASTTPARVELLSDQANTDAEREARRLRGALSSYSQQLATLRLLVRGVNPAVLRPINIDEIDVSTPSGRSALLLGMMSYFFIFACLMGGMYLAIDTTAGERERGSLEPLLSLPVTRDQLIFGKIAATCLFMALSLMLSLASFFCGAQGHAVAGAWHDAQLRSRRHARGFPALRAIYSAGRRANDAGCLFHEKLSRSADLAQRTADRANAPDPDRQPADTQAATRVHVHSQFEPAPAAGRPRQERTGEQPACCDFGHQHPVSGRAVNLGLCAPVPARRPARLGRHDLSCQGG